MTEKKLVNIIVLGPIIFIPLVVLLLSFFVARANYNTLNYHKEEIEHKLRFTEEQNSKATVIAVSKHIQYRKSITKEKLTSRVKHRVDNAYDIAHSIYDKYVGKLSASEIKGFIQTALRPLMWNDGESFIWIVGYDGTFHLAPKYLKELEGKSIFNMSCKENHDVIRKEMEICKYQNDGFLWNKFTKPDAKSTILYEQLAYVRAFNHYDWYLGSAEYLATAIDKTDKSLMLSIKKIVDNNNKYIFIFNKKGDILLNPTLSDSEGKNIFKSDNKEAKIIIQNILDSLKGKKELKLSYTWINPLNKTREKKHVYARHIPGTDWIIGSGYYDSDIEQKLSINHAQAYEDYKEKYQNLLIISIVLIIISLIISLFISKLMKNSFAKYKKKIGKHTYELESLNDSLEQKVLQRTKKLESITYELEILAKTDFLTKVHNRYSIMEILNQEMSRARRSETSLTVMMFDIDYFKRVNDNFGHDAGDAVLVSLSSVVQTILRDIDFMGRYGGEEFMVIMSNTDMEQAKSISQRIRKKVEEHSFNVIGVLTISLGLVEMKSDEDSDALFKRLDDLLYYSKDNGRNRLSY